MKRMSWLLTIVFLLAGALPAAAAYQPLKVDPSRFIFEGKPGQQVTGAISVTNQGDGPASPKAMLNDWTINLANELVPGEAGSLLSTTLNGWLKFNPRQFTLAPKNIQTVRFTIRIPQDAEPGERRGMLFFEQVIPPEATTTGAAVKVQLGATVYVAVLPVKRTCEVAGARLESAGTDATIITAAIKGTGNAHYRGTASFEIRNANNETVVAKGELEPIIILPDVTAEFAGRWNGVLGGGKYKLTLVLRSSEPKMAPLTWSKELVVP